MTCSVGFRNHNIMHSKMMFRSLLIFLTTLCALMPVSMTSAQVPTTEQALERTWLDADGKPLPFRTDEEIEEFLRSASVVSETTIGVGINRSQKVLLEKDGIRMHSIFREVDIRERNRKVGDRTFFAFADSYLFETAAYSLAKMLGLHNVPPVVLRDIERRRGTLQIWVEDALDEESAKFAPPAGWARQYSNMTLFDNLVFNIDRNQGNILVDKNYTLWMIDHTRAFQSVYKLLEPERITRVNRSVWERLIYLTDDELRSALSDYLEGPEINALVRRRQLLIEHVKALIDEYGRETVFY